MTAAWTPELEARARELLDAPATLEVAFLAEGPDLLEAAVAEISELRSAVFAAAIVSILGPSPHDRLIRPEIRESLDRYVNDGIPTGGFLEAVIANDLMDAVGRADRENLHAIAAIAAYVYNDMPGDCHGSREVYDQWLHRHAERRRAARSDGAGQ